MDTEVRMDTVYLTVEQIATLYRLSKTSNIGIQLRSTASAESAIHLNSVLKDGTEGWTTVLAEGDGPNLSPKGRPLWER
jgi:hypothetical protein